MIPSGIRSLFRRKDDTNQSIREGLKETDVAYLHIVTNPNFDPGFDNDVRLLERGRLNGMMHFLYKTMHHLPGSIFDSGHITTFRAT